MIQNKVLLIRVKGVSGLKPKIKKNFESLGLLRPYSARILELNPSLRGKLQILRGYLLITPLQGGVLDLLEGYFGSQGVYLEGDVFGLQPPRRGFIKSRSYSLHNSSVHERIVERILVR